MDNLNSNTCCVCGKVFEKRKSLHSHLKAHKIKVDEYYHRYFERLDLHTGELIKFKNLEQYLSTDFNSKNNLGFWLKSQTEDDAKTYCKELFKKRISEKKIKYSPSQVELRSSKKLPPMNFLENLFKGYYKFCESLQLKNKYVKTEPVDLKVFDDYKILVDTREAKPHIIKGISTIKKLNFGDYLFFSKEKKHHVYFERKSLYDFIGTFSSGFERFEKELERASEAGQNLIIIVEAKMSEAMSFTYKSQFKIKMKITPDFIFRRVRDLSQQYNNIQFLFVDGREESIEYMTRVFRIGEDFNKIDLQYAYDMKLL